VTDSFREWSRRPLQTAWKTGTAPSFRDAWTLGVFGPFVLGVWLDNFDGRPNSALIGRETAAPLYFRLIEGVRSLERDWLSGPDRWRTPAGRLHVKKVPVCAVSGGFPEAFCPHRKEAWIIPGPSPIRHCDVLRQVLVSQRNGRRKCHDEPSNGYSLRTFEFWPTDLLKSFRDFGVHNAPPPAFKRGCEGFEPTDLAAAAPSITSPKGAVTYSLSLRSGERTELPFTAVADGGTTQLDWFVQGQYVDRSLPKQNLFWRARRGSFRVTAVDDRGRSASVPLVVRMVD